MTTQKRVLFVEPNDMQRKVYTAVLKPADNEWELTFSSSAADALKKCSYTPFDIVVTLNRLPDQSGIELLEQLRETYPEMIRFLLIEEAEKNSMRSLVSSAQQVLVKPIKLQAFTTQINRALTLRNLVRDPAILKVLGSTDTLPPLPRIFQELSRMLSDANTSLQEAGELISQDIVLSSKILKMANSALFSLRSPAQSVKQAVPLLGSSAVSSLVFSQSMANTFKGAAGGEEFFEELNQHSIAVATATTRILANWKAGRELIEKSIFCGMAHDLGKLVLARYAPEKWTQIQTELQTGEKTDIELEREMIGLTHADLTAYLLAIWGFPNDQIIAIGFHHEPSRFSESEFGLMGALHIAENCCRSESEKENFDWDYLTKNRITPDDIEAIKVMLAEPDD